MPLGLLDTPPSRHRILDGLLNRLLRMSLCHAELWRRRFGASTERPRARVEIPGERPLTFGAGEEAYSQYRFHGYIVGCFLGSGTQ